MFGNVYITALSGIALAILNHDEKNKILFCMYAVYPLSVVMYSVLIVTLTELYFETFLILFNT